MLQDLCATCCCCCLQVLEQRLFSEGLHVLGKPPSPDQMQQYLGAYFGEDLPAEAVEAVAHSNGGGLDDVRGRLERAYRQVRLWQLLCSPWQILREGLPCAASALGPLQAITSA